MKYEFVAVDFDGTLCENCFPEIGAPKTAVIDYVKALAAEGSKIILHTCREDGTRLLLAEAVDFCNDQEIPLFAVNENPANTYAALNGLTHDAGRKLYADLYIDDKALNPADIAGGAEQSGALHAVRARLIDSLAVLGVREYAASAYIRTAIRLIDRRLEHEKET